MKRLYHALCDLIEAKAEAIAKPTPAPEPQNEGHRLMPNRVPPKIVDYPPFPPAN